MSQISLLKEIKKLNNDIIRKITNKYKKLNINITPIQAKFLITLSKSKEKLCQKDLEKIMFSNKSTVSAILSSMEKNNLLYRKVSDTDLRLNYLILTPKGIQIANFLEADREKIEEILFSGITNEEYFIVEKTIEKIRKNIERI